MRNQSSFALNEFWLRLTGRDEDCAASHDTTHLLAAIAPPTWSGRNVIAQMSLSLVLDVERKDVVGKVFPLWGVRQQMVPVL
jgi:hypothetical protein